MWAPFGRPSVVSPITAKSDRTTLCACSITHQHSIAQLHVSYPVKNTYVHQCYLRHCLFRQSSNHFFCKKWFCSLYADCTYFVALMRGLTNIIWDSLNIFKLPTKNVKNSWKYLPTFHDSMCWILSKLSEWKTIGFSRGTSKDKRFAGPFGNSSSPKQLQQPRHPALPGILLVTCTRTRTFFRHMWF